MSNVAQSLVHFHVSRFPLDSYGTRMHIAECKLLFHVKVITYFNMLLSCLY